MDSFYFSLEQSAWWLLVIIPVSAGLAWLFYSGKSQWAQRWTWLLRGLRFLSVFLILFLLLNPSFTKVVSFKEKQVFPVLIDNSESAILAGNTDKQLKEGIKLISQKLKDKGYQPRFLVHGKTVEDPDSIAFNNGSSDLASLLTSGDEMMPRSGNGKMLLISDGIYNSGMAPVYKSFRSDILCLGFGDTVAKKDLVLKSVQNNSVAFLGNKFTIRAEIQAIGFPGKQLVVNLRNNKGVVEKKTISVKGDFYQENLDFIVPATSKGFQRYTVEIVKEAGEGNIENNIQYAYVDVVDDRENILIVANSPHPTIKAIRTALLKAENINLEVLIPGISAPKNKTFDLVILQNCLVNSIPEASAYIKENTSLLYIAGTSTDYQRFNLENGLVEVRSMNQVDQAQTVLNPGFAKFKIESDAAPVISDLPPVEVTFGEIRIKGGADILLYQKINGIQTEKPLLIFGQTKRKTGVLLTDGLWLWRMYEAQSKEVSKNTDEIITKTIQYLSSKEDKRKFRIYPHQKEYLQGDQVQIETELFNDIYERVQDGNFKFTIQSEGSKNKSVDFQSSDQNTALVLSTLQAGIYKISASVKYGGKTLSASSEFVIKERKLEKLDLTAKHTMLRELSKKNGGTFYAWNQLNKLISELENLQAKAIWKSTEKTKELIDEIWYFCIILVFLTTEWMIRRYNGGY